MAVLRLRQAGFRSQREGAYWVRLDFVLYTVALDVDAPLKLAIDAVSYALAIDDRWVGELHVTKAVVPHRSEQRLAVWTRIRLVADRDEWRKIPERRSSSRVTYTGRLARSGEVGWERGRYYTRSRKVLGTSFREYVGMGPKALQQAEAAWRLERAAARKVKRGCEEIDALCRLAIAGAMEAVGYHQHDRGEWRKRRG